jgi:hypothetical protein
MAGGPGFEPRLTESESAPTEAVVGVLRRQGLQPDSPCCFCPIVTNMAEYATASGSAEMVTPKNRLAGGEAPLLCRQHGIPQGPARADARRSTGRSPQRVIGTTPLFEALPHLGGEQVGQRGRVAEEVSLSGPAGHLGIANGGYVGHGAIGNPGRQRDVARIGAKRKCGTSSKTIPRPLPDCASLIRATRFEKRLTRPASPRWRTRHAPG